MGEMQIIGGDDLSMLAGKVCKREPRCVCSEVWRRQEIRGLRLGRVLHSPGLVNSCQRLWDSLKSPL